MHQETVHPSVDEAVINPAETGYLSSEFVGEREQYYHQRPNKPVVVSCSDERATSDASAEAVATAYPEAADIREVTVGAFGQVAGMAKIVAVAGEAQQAGFIEKMGGFDAVFNMIAERMQADDSNLAVRPALHSAVANEIKAAGEEGIDNPQALFCQHGSLGTGCAYCMGVGAVANLVASDAGVQQVVTSDVRKFAGENYGNAVELIVKANQTFVGAMGADLAVSREDYKNSGLPVMVLKGHSEGDAHMAAADTGVLVNFNAMELPSSTQAAADKRDFYRVDVAAEVLAIQRLVPELKLSSETLALAILTDQVAVRAVLAHHTTPDHALDATRVGVGARGGNWQSMLAQVEELRNA